jgi:hypothetical protein
MAAIMRVSCGLGVTIKLGVDDALAIILTTSRETKRE